MTLKIMHVEDDADTRKAVKTLLKTEGFEVSGASSGRTCLSKLEVEIPDLILIDIMMPGMSGWDLFNKIRKRKINSKVIFLSVLPVSKEKIREMHKQGVSGYVMKPFTPKELLGKIRKITPKQIVIERKELSVYDFIKKMEGKKKVKILSELITNLLILHIIKNKKQACCQEIMVDLLSELNNLVNSGLISKYLSHERFKLPKGKYEDLEYQLKKKLLSRFNIFVGSNVLYSLLSKWEKEGIIESETINRKKAYRLTEKGNQGIELLQNYFLKVLKIQFCEVKIHG